MREITLLPGALFAPGHCMICGGSEGPMIDTCVDIPGDGRMYICVRLCAPLIASLVGGHQPKAKCEQTKVDGSRCTADALPGRTVCVAHSKTAKREVEHALA